MKTVFHGLLPYRGKLFHSLSLKIISTLLELTLPVILSYILKEAFREQSLRKVIILGLLMILCAGLACILGIRAHHISTRVTRDFTENLRQRLFSKALHLSAAQEEKFTVASLESRITTDTYNVYHFVNMLPRMGIRAPVLMIGSIIVSFLMDPYLASVMLVLLPLAALLACLIAKYSIPLYTKVQQCIDRMIRVVREDSHGIRVIKALSKDDYEHRRFNKANQALVKSERQVRFLMSSANPAMTFLMNLGIVAVVTLSANRISHAQSSPETVLAFMQYFTQISGAMIALTRIYSMTNKCIASANRIEKVLICEDEMKERDDSRYPGINTDNIIQFDNVSFSYNGKTDDLKSIDFSLKKGQSLGIIGATGSGKSTIIKTLLRFHDVTGGAVRIRGKDIRTIPREELYAEFGTVMQSDFLFADTIEENIRFGRGISHDEIIAAAKAAQAHDFIMEFPDGYAHRLAQKAANVSGGQKQRILIARALAGRPEILILDDSSSALDYKTEARLRSNLSTELTETTKIIIAQRVSSIKACDRILVLDSGKVIGCGTHDQLLQTCSAYRAIHDSQTGGEIIE